MDDMAVDSDEEVDYSKMDQVCWHQLLGAASKVAPDPERIPWERSSTGAGC